jgi:6-phosphogluconolactonase (cycloisomerase 2 family)
MARKTWVAAFAAAAAVWAAPALAVGDGGLSQLASPNDCISEGGSVCGTTTAKGLTGVFGLAFSRDGKHVYAASQDSDAVGVFSRNTQTGGLAQLSAPNNCISQGGSACGTTSGKGLDGANQVALSPDGKNAYVTSSQSNAISVFARNATTGALTQLPAPNDCISQGGVVCGTTNGKGLDFPWGVAVSPDGKHVYVASLDSDAVAAFSRNATTGALTQLAAPNDCVSQGGLVCGTTSGKGLDGAFPLAMSPDGKHVYVGGYESDAIAAFSRNATTGALTQLAAPNDCVSQGGAVCGATNGKGLDGTNGMATSTDGKSLYVASFGSNAVAALARNTQTGALTQLASPKDCISEGGSVCGTTSGKGLVSAAGVAVAPDGRHVYVAGSDGNDVAAFSRSTQSGALTQLASPDNCISQGGSVCGTTTGKGLEDAYTVGVAPGGRHVYVAADVAKALAAFVRELPPLTVQPDVTDLDVEILTRGIRISRKGVAKVKLECDSPDGDSCDNGLAQIVTAKRVTVSRKRRVTLAKRSFSIRAGKRKTVKLRLSKRKRRLVRRLRKVKVKIKVTASDDAGNKALDKETVKLKAPKRRRRS